MREAFVVGEAAQQVGAGAGLEHLKFLVADVGVLQLVDLLVDGVAHLVGRVSGHGHGVEGEQAGILLSGNPAEALGVGAIFWSRTRLL
jgi:hypothetical protein